MKIFKLQVGVIFTRVETGQGSSGVSVTFIGVMTQIIVRIGF